jgi:hypothetical protein
MQWIFPARIGINGSILWDFPHVFSIAVILQVFKLGSGGEGGRNDKIA